MKRVVIFCIVLLCAIDIFAQKPIIAVYVATNDADNSETQSIKKVLEAKLVEAIHKSNLFTATERSEAFLVQIKKEHNYQQSGQVSDGQIIEQARKSGAQYLCLADIFELFGDRFVSARLVELESGDMQATTNSSGSIKSLTDLVLISSEVANNLIKETPQAKVIEQEIKVQQEQERKIREEQDRKKQQERERLAREERERKSHEEQERKVRQLREAGGTKVITCNDTELPGWGVSLGTISFATSQTWTVGSQIWSDAVQATNCNKTNFNGGTNDNYNSDCRSNHTQKGDLFSWCAVVRFGDKLCPSPWKVPTVHDFLNLDKALGGEGGYGYSDHKKKIINKYLNSWGGTYSGIYDNGRMYSQGSVGRFWTQSQANIFLGHELGFGDIGGVAMVMAASTSTKNTGMSLRCVRAK